jgi:hypothetical protein
VIVELSFFELHQAANVGVMRNIQARRRERPDTYGKNVYDMEGGWGVHIEGAAAEMAVAKTLGIYWEGVWREIDRSRGDVGGYQVRSTLRRDGCLILHPSDDDLAMFVLVVGAAPKLRIAGQIRAVEGKQIEYWREGTGRPAFFVPQSKLTPLQERQAA